MAAPLDPRPDGTDPVVSVVFPAYNCPEYVGEAVESVLAQTFTDFELILIDDGSTDETPRVLAGFRDPRIRLLRQENAGLAATLNRGISLARGRYVARQDQDDVSRPERFARQVAYLDKHPACALVGTWAEIWRGRERTERMHRHPCDSPSLKLELLFNNPFVHSSVMLRRAALVDTGGYTTDPNRQPPEDYDLWSRIARTWDVANIGEPLHVYREVEGSMSRAGPSPFLDRLVTLCAENIAWAAGLSGPNDTTVNIAALVHNAPHRLTGSLDRRAVHEILALAGARLATPALKADFERRMHVRADQLIAVHEHLRGPSLGRRVRSAVARAARAVMRP